MLSWKPTYVMFAGRGIAALFLLGALLQPDLPRTVTLTALIEKSDSVSLHPVASLGESLTSDVRRAGRQLELIPKEFGETATNASISDALAEALWAMESATDNAIVIVSDGNWPESVKSILAATTAADLPVYWLPTRNHINQLQILDVSAPARAQPGQPVAVTIDSVVADDEAYDFVLYANGEPVARASRDTQTVLNFSITATGSVALSVEAINRSTQQIVARHDDIAVVNVISPPTLLLIASKASPIGESLQAGGWPLTQVTPREFPAYADSLHQFSALILDDVAATSLSNSGWSSISAAVRRRALGLLVLGGSNSFALGAYRDSILEELLPVISEPPETVQPAALAFLVDVSGSMERGTRAAFAVAQSAVAETAAGLRPADRVGVFAFDVEARQLLSIGARNDHVAAIQRAWPERASGGTSVIPAVELALSALAEESTEQKLLIMITDGMLSDADVVKLSDKFADSDVELIAMVITSDPASAPLVRMQSADRISMLLIDEVLRLPTLLRHEVESHRPAVVQERTIPETEPTTVINDVNSGWPALDAYALTRPRPEVQVLLKSPKGDPLLARWTIGAGRVAVLTGGLDAWAKDWLVWDDWSSFVSGLLSSVIVGNADRSRVTVEYVDNNVSAILVDIGRGTSEPNRATLVSPSDVVAELELKRIAPGRYRAATPAMGPGEYTFTWGSNTTLARHRFVSHQLSASAATGRSDARRYVESGLLREWTSDTASELAAATSYKATLALLALLIFLATVAAERAPLRQWLTLKPIAQRESRPTPR